MPAVKYLLILLASLISMMKMVLPHCIKTVKRDGFNQIIVHRKFSNGSIAILDDFGKYGVYSSSGSQIYFEELALPIEPLMNERLKLYMATIDSTGSICFIGVNSYSYTYSNGKIASSLLMDTKFVQYLTLALRGLPDMGGALYTNSFQTYSVKSSGFLNTDVSLTQGNPFNISYIARITPNMMLQEYHIVSLSTTVVSLQINKVYGSFTLNTTDANYLSSLFVFSQAYHIFSSIGTSATHMAYAYIETRASTSSPYPQKLVIHTRGVASLVTITIPINIGNFWSVAIHPTANKIYCLTISGDLYVYNFNPGALPATVPTFPASSPSATYLNFYDKYAELEVVDATTLLFRTRETLSYFDLGTNSFTFHFNVKPTFSRSIVGTNQMFLIYFNSKAKLYDTDTHSVVSTFTPFTGSIKEIAISPNSSPPRIYVLYANKIDSYSYSFGSPGVFTPLLSKNLAQMLAEITPILPSVTSVERLQDIEVLLISPYPLCVVLLTNHNTGSPVQSISIYLSGSTLARVPSSILTLSSTNAYLAVNAMVSQSTLKDMLVYTANDANIYSNWQGTSFGTNTIYNNHYSQDSTYWPLLASTIYIGSPYMSKTTTRYDSSDVSSITSMSLGSYSSLYARNNVLGSNDVNSMRDYSAYRVYEVEHTRGGLKKKIASFNNYGGTIQHLLGPVGKPNTVFYSIFTITGIPYQLANNKVYVTDGENNLYSFSTTECTQDSSLGTFQKFSDTCSLTNCITCDLFVDNVCALCKLGYKPDATGACVQMCNDYQVNRSYCALQCPIEFYRVEDIPKLCITAAMCKSINYYIMGDRCLSAACPTGDFTTSSSNFCVPTDSTKGIMYNDDFTAYTLCPAGTYYFFHFKQCMPLSNLPSAGYTIIPPDAINYGKIYCDNTIGYIFDVYSQRCVMSCDQYSGTHPEMGKFCASPPACQFIGYFTDSLTFAPSLKCVPSCQPGAWVDLTINNCTTSCPPLITLAVPTLLICVKDCPQSFYSTETQCLTKVQCGAMSWLAIDSTMKCIAACPTNLFYSPSTNECVSGGTPVPDIRCSPGQGLDPATQLCVKLPDQAFSCPEGLFPDETNTKCISGLGGQRSLRGFPWEEIFKAFMRFHSSARILTPILISTMFDIRSCAMLVVIGHTYTKLIQQTYLPFVLADDYWGWRYYYVFKDYFDDAINYFMSVFSSEEMLSQTRRNVCNAGLNKMCQIGIEENFYTSMVGTIFMFLLQCLFVALIALIVGLYRKKELKESIFLKLKSLMFYTFLINIDGKLALSVILNAYVLHFDLASLSIFKMVGLGVLILYLFCLILILISSDIRQRFLKTPAKQLYHKWKLIFSEIVHSEYIVPFIKLYLLHDFLFSILLTLGSITSPLQMYLWAGVELLLTVLLLKFRVFKVIMLNFRQPILGVVTFAVFITMAVITGDKIRKEEVSMTFFISSAAIISLDLINVIFIWIQAIMKLIKLWKSSSQGLPAALGEEKNKAPLLSMKRLNFKNSIIKVQPDSKTALVNKDSDKQTNQMNIPSLDMFSPSPYPKLHSDTNTTPQGNTGLVHAISSNDLPAISTDRQGIMNLECNDDIYAGGTPPVLMKLRMIRVKPKPKPT